MIYPIPNLSECPICQARADQIENHIRFWHCTCCCCEFIINEQGRIVRKLPAKHLYEADVSGNEMSDP